MGQLLQITFHSTQDEAQNRTVSIGLYNTVSTTGIEFEASKGNFRIVFEKVNESRPVSHLVDFNCDRFLAYRFYVKSNHGIMSYHFSC